MPTLSVACPRSRGHEQILAHRIQPAPDLIRGANIT